MVYDPTSPPFLFFSLLEKFLFIRGEGGFNDSSLSRELFSPFRGLFQTGCSGCDLMKLAGRKGSFLKFYAVKLSIKIG